MESRFIENELPSIGVESQFIENESLSVGVE